jgi:hypothetical protein
MPSTGKGRHLHKKSQNYKTLIMKYLIAVLLFATAFFSCKEDDPPSYAELLEGSWKAISVKQTVDLVTEFSHDHKIRFRFGGTNTGVTTWTLVKKNAETIFFTEDSKTILDEEKKTLFFDEEFGIPWVMDGKPVTMDIVELTQDYLVLRGVTDDGVEAKIRASKEK